MKSEKEMHYILLGNARIPAKLLYANHETLLNQYSEYLGTILGEGYISIKEDHMLTNLRKKMDITEEEHLKLLEEKGWTLDKYKLAIDSMAPQYLSFLRTIVLDESISNLEVELLIQMREKYHITDEMHRKALAEVGLSEKEFNEVIREGISHATIELYGKPNHAVKYYNEEIEAESCRGFIKWPHLRQWWERDTSTGELTLHREKEERSASWSELFYDLALVSIVSLLTHCLANHPENWKRFVLMFLSVYYLWSSTQTYSTRFERNDLLTRIFYATHMSGLIYLGIETPSTFLGEHSKFGWAYLFAGVPVTVLWLISLFTEKKTKAGLIHIVCQIASLIPYVLTEYYHEYFDWLALISILILQFPYFVLPLIIRIFGVDSTRGTPIFTIPINIEHSVERHGCFVLIVLGESVSALVSDASEINNKTLDMYLCAIIGLIIVCSLKWLHFDVQGQPKVQHAMRRKGPYGLIWLYYIHILITISIVATTAGWISIARNAWLVESESPSNDPNDSIITSFTNDTIPSDEAMLKTSEWLFCSSLGIVLLCIAIEGVLSVEPKWHIINIKYRILARVAVAATIALLPLSDLEPFILISIVAVIMVLLSQFELIGVLPNKEHFSTTIPFEEETEETGSQQHILIEENPMMEGQVEIDNMIM